MESEKIKILEYIKINMLDLLNSEQMNKLNNVVLNVLCEYNIEKKSTELAVYDNTNEKALEFFMGIMKIKGKKDNTIEQYIKTTRKCLNTIGKNYKDINDIDMLRYFSLLSTKVSKTTYNNYVRYINPFFTWLQKNNYIDRNPMCQIDAVKVDYVEKKPFAQSEMDCLKDNAKTIRDKALMSFLYSTGCRINEALSLNISDIVDDECIVFGKGGKERVVYLNDSCKYYINQYINSRKDDNEALFVTNRRSTKTGKYERLKSGGARCMIRQLGKEYGIEKAHPHRFRRTNCTTLLSRGIPIQEVQVMMGHQDISTTTIYNSLNKENLKHKHRVSL